MASIVEQFEAFKKVRELEREKQLTKEFESFLMEQIRGITLPVGPQGDVGPQGPSGPQGPAGPVGPQGPSGARGKDGKAGVAGEAGKPGKDGSDAPKASRIVINSIIRDDGNRIQTIDFDVEYD